MAATRLCAVLGAILWATTACAGQTGTPAEQKNLTATALPPVSGPPPTTPIQVIADPRAVDLKPHVWTRYDVMDGNRVRLHFTITGQAACNVLGTVAVAETADRVALTIHIGRFPESNCGAKTLKAAAVYTEVELSAPLGTRTITDGAK